MDATLDHAQAALAAARGAGLAVERGDVVAVASNVLVRLEPGPLAALPTAATSPFRDPAEADNHPGNVVWTADRPLWSDWEDAHLARLEWDLACLLAATRPRGDDFGWAEAALAAHAGPYDPQLRDACVDARIAQGAAHVAATGRGDPGVHLAWLGSRAS